MRVFNWPFSTEDLERVDAPQIPVPCIYCDESIMPGEPGVLVPYISSEMVKIDPAHRECFLRQLFGSIGHLLGMCTCKHRKRVLPYEVHMEDPHWMTKRMAAKTVVLYIEHGALPVFFRDRVRLQFAKWVLAKSDRTQDEIHRAIVALQSTDEVNPEIGETEALLLALWVH